MGPTFCCKGSTIMANGNNAAREWWMVVLQRQGLAVVLILAATSYSMWYVLPNVGSFAREVWTWHKTTVDKVTANGEAQAKAITEFSAAFEKNTAAMRQLTDSNTPVLNRIDQGIQELNSKIDRISPIDSDKTARN